jgi:outer membrane protein assembly factor BamE (lipoprotein component of BamABCDE complex)
MARNLNLVAALALGLAGLTGISGAVLADTVAVDGGIAVKKSDVATPGRGMTMDQVAAKFGAPTNKIPAVGQPPISRWDYPGFVVYFERNHVIHSVVANS